MRALIGSSVIALGIILTGARPALADDVPLHLHCLTTPGTTTAIAGGVTANAPHDAFSRFHFGVHLGAFTNTPHTVTPTSPTGSC